MLITVFCACGETAQSEVTTEALATAAITEGGTETDVVTTDTERLTPDVGDVNFGGHVFRVLTRGTSSSTWYSRDIYADTVTGDIINDAVFSRNSAMEQKYNFKVEEVGSKTPADDALKALSGGEDIYDMFCFKVQADITSLLLKGYLRNLNNVEAMDLDRPYYDQNSRAAFTISKKLYLVTGDLLTMDNDATRCVMFNKNMFTEFNIEGIIGGTLYEKMQDKKWTLDMLTTCAKTVSKDLNGNGVWEITDQYGMVSEQFNVLALYNASGRLTYEKDSDDVPYLACNTEDGLAVFSKVITLLNDSSYCRHYSNAYNEAIPQFKEGLVLFYPAQLADVPLLREMDFDFGILPLPMYDENQDGYHSPVTTYGCNCIAIPTSVQDVDRAAKIIEILSCESMYVLTPAYYELNLKYKLARDMESSPSIDVILGTAVFDLGYMWKWGGIYSVITNAFNNNTPDLSSQLKSIEKLAKNEIKKNVADIEAIVN